MITVTSGGTPAPPVATAVRLAQGPAQLRQMLLIRRFEERCVELGELAWSVVNRTNDRFALEWPECDVNRSHAERSLHLVRDVGFSSPVESGHQLR